MRADTAVSFIWLFYYLSPNTSPRATQVTALLNDVDAEKLNQQNFSLDEKHHVWVEGTNLLGWDDSRAYLEKME